MQRADDLVRSSDSYTAAYLLRYIEHGFPTKDEWRTFEVQLLYYGIMKKNFRLPGSSDHVYAEQMEMTRTTLQELRHTAMNGDSSSQLVVVELDEYWLIFQSTSL